MHKEKQNIHKEKHKCLPYPQTKMVHCPQCAQKYNTRGKAQARQTKKNAPPNLDGKHCTWKTKQKQTKSKDKENNEECLPQVLSLTSSARLVTWGYNHFE